LTHRSCRCSLFTARGRSHALTWKDARSRSFTKLPDDPALAQIVNSALTQNGFRRSYDVVYRPLCPACNACTPVRIPVADFKPNSTQRRILRRNEGYSLHPNSSLATPELFTLFHGYEEARHPDSDMAHMNYQGFRAMLEDGAAAKTLYTAIRARAIDASSETAKDGENLIGAVLTDRLTDGLSAVYSFFGAEDERRSLGTWIILKLVETVREMGLSYLYLGYWIAESRKMAYKANFHPVEALGPNGWRLLPQSR